MRAFPLIRDLVTDVSWNYEVNKTIAPFSRPPTCPRRTWRWQQEDIERVQEFRKCIECFLCQDVCHVLRNHETEQPFMGPRFLVRARRARDAPDRPGRPDARTSRTSGGIGFCNITKCCTEVCPEHIKITDNAIIPLKERVADEYYDPIQMAWRKLRGGEASRRAPVGCRAPAGAGAVRRREPDERPGAPDAWPPSAGAAVVSRPRRAVRRPDRRGGARQPGSRVGRGGADRPRRGRTRATRARRPTRRSPSSSASRRTTSPSTPASSGPSRWPRELGAREVELLLDSKLIVEQLAGRWRVKDAKLDPALGGGAPDAARLRPLVRRPTSRGPRTAPPTRSCNEAIDRVAAGGPASVVPRRRGPGRRGSPVGGWRARRLARCQRGGRMAARRVRPGRWHEESPSSAAQGSG